MSKDLRHYFGCGCFKKKVLWNWSPLTMLLIGMEQVKGPYPEVALNDPAANSTRVRPLTKINNRDLFVDECGFVIRDSLQTSTKLLNTLSGTLCSRISTNNFDGLQIFTSWQWWWSLLFLQFPPSRMISRLPIFLLTSTTSPITSIVPLIFVLTVAAVREAFEDFVSQSSCQIRSTIFLICSSAGPLPSWQRSQQS